jgi:hypothetical protein
MGSSPRSQPAAAIAAMPVTRLAGARRLTGGGLVITGWASR